MEYNYTQADIEELLSPESIRGRSQKILELCQNGEGNFRVHLDKMDEAADYVVETIQSKYPDLEIPYHSRWGHFQVGHVDRLATLKQMLSDASDKEIARVKFDLVITSVLLDAGAGMDWRYHDVKTGAYYGRSEGLAVASFNMFVNGVFSSNTSIPLRADAPALIHIVEDHIINGFQVSLSNPLNGTAGRTELLHKLGKEIEAQPKYFGEDLMKRPGNLVDYFLKNASDGQLSASFMLKTILRALGGIWPSRIHLGETPLGDVWHHPKLAKDGDPNGLVPFHKLSQWLTYSLIEPLEELGLEITDLNVLTGLAEYRNGGLFIDLGVIEPVDPELLRQSHHSSSAFVVEWRALTICLLDQISEKIRQKLGQSEDKFPLVKVLEGGTWWAGRKLAQIKRKNGRPPIEIISDGTVF